MAVGEWDHRELCPDGGCVGVIGPEGTCKVCGHAAPNWGDERQRGLVADPDEEVDDDAPDADADDAPHDVVDPIVPGAPAALGAAGAWLDRRLCGDGSCIGVLDERGRCRVCGKTATGANQPPAGEPSDAANDDPNDATNDDPNDAANDDPNDVPNEERRLCPDGACVGVLGDDGTCKLCGEAPA